MLINMRVCGVQPGRELYVSVTQKIPRMLLIKFFERYDDHSSDVQVFCDWLLARVHTRRRVDERLDNQSHKMIGETSKGSRQRHHTHSTQSTGGRAQKDRYKSVDSTISGDSKSYHQSSCVKCHGNHYLRNCPVFKDLTTAQRWHFIKSHQDVCAWCLCVGHWSKDCTKDGYQHCQKPHHALLHFERTSCNGPKSKADKSSASSSSQQKPIPPAAVPKEDQTHMTHCGTASDSLVSFMLVPIVFVNGHVKVSGTALLDPASSTSYVRQSVATALGLHGDI